MMGPDQFLLCKIAEEASEVAQRALKAQQFGLGEVQSGHPLNNMDRLIEELKDLRTVADELTERAGGSWRPTAEERRSRLQKIEKYWLLAESLGQVSEL
jgi:hypothetical protein